MNANTIIRPASAIIHALAVCALALPAASRAEVIYENDFATRASAAPVPSLDWHAYDYVTDLLANTNGANPFVDSANVNTSKMQDGWIKTKDSNTDARVWRGTSGKDNPAAVLGLASTGSTNATCFLKQRIGGTFTNGTVTIQFDFQPPASWGRYEQSDTAGNVQRRTTLSFGDENFFSPSPSVSQSKVYEHTIGSVGVVLVSGSGRKVYWNANKDVADAAPSDQAVTQGNWLRAVATIDLDTRKWGFSMFDMGASQPAMDAATPASAAYSASDLSFADNSVTSISSIALGGIGVFWRAGNSYSEDKEPTHAAWFDNIRISHNGEACYENDFVTRRWRTFGGTASHTYVADCLVTNQVKNEVYVLEQYLVSSRDGDGSAVQPIGIDGWRRTHNKNGTANAYARSDDKGGPYLRFNSDSTDTTSQGYLAQPFGSTISSGKVRLAVDARLPSKWDANGALWVTLAGEQYYNATPDKSRNYRWASVGIRGRDNTPTFIYNSSGDACDPTPNGNITKEHWYRLVVTADLDARTTDFSVFEQGTSYPNSATDDGTCIFATNGIGRISNISSLSCFSLGAVKRLVYFDNVKIWHTPTGSESATLLYENYFSARTIYAQDTRIAPLGGTLSLNPVGQDGWRHLYVNNPPLFIDWADGNPALTFSRYNFELYGAQDLGQTIRTGTLVAQADMRPPKGWLQNGGAAYLRLGGDAFMQGSLRDDDTYFLKNLATSFGFKNMNAGKSDNLYTNSTIVAYCGDRAGGGVMTNAAVAVDTSHWYRFVATADMAKSQCDVAVYDMGATHPTLATATPAEPVATFTELPFRRARADLGGISCVGASSDKTAQSLYDPSLQPMIDNIRVSHQQSAFVLTVR